MALGMLKAVRGLSFQRWWANVARPSSVSEVGARTSEVRFFPGSGHFLPDMLGRLSAHEETSPPNHIHRPLGGGGILFNFTVESRFVLRANKQLLGWPAQSPPKKRRRVASSQG